MKYAKILNVICISAIFIAGCETIPQTNDIIGTPGEPTTEKIPLNDPQIFNYEGHISGLYPWGNELGTGTYATKYENTCLALMPRDTDGNETNNGKIVIVAIGGSNPQIIYSGLINAQLQDPGFGSQLVFINAAQNAAYFGSIMHPEGDYWNSVQYKLDSAGVTAAQVAVVFCIEDDQTNWDTTFERAFEIRDDYVEALSVIRDKYPNCKLFYPADRGFGGYTTSEENQEPRGYLNGWGVKYLVEDYINGVLPEYPVVNWLDYYWANGAEPRWDGLTYYPTDFRGNEMLHYTDEKGNELGAGTHERLKNDPGAKYWYN